MSLARRIAKAGVLKTARAVGHEFHRRGNIARSMADALEHLRALGFMPGTVFDVGVAEGTPDLYRVYPEAEYVLIEPLAEYEPALQGILTRLKGRYVLAAAGEEAGRTQISIRDDASSAKREIDKSDTTLEWRTIPTVTIDRLCV